MVARAAAVVLAAGSGTRTGLAHNKVYAPVAGRTLLAWALAAFEAAPEIDDVVVVVRADERARAEDECRAVIATKVRAVVDGGASRAGSERAGLAALAAAIEGGDVDAVLVHDAARPFPRPSLIAAVLGAARAVGGAVPGVAMADGVFRRRGEHVDPVGGDDLYRVQTPQGFRAPPLLAAARAAAAAGFEGADTAEWVGRFAPEVAVVVVPGDPDNVKVTTAPDLTSAEAIAAARHGPRGRRDDGYAASS